MGSGVRELEVRGEDRRDIAYELTVDSTGPDEATAKLFAQTGLHRRTISARPSPFSVFP